MFSWLIADRYVRSPAVEFVDGALQDGFEVEPFALGWRVATFGVEQPDDRGDVGPTMERAPSVCSHSRVNNSAQSKRSYRRLIRQWATSIDRAPIRAASNRQDPTPPFAAVTVSRVEVAVDEGAVGVEAGAVEDLDRFLIAHSFRARS